MSNLIRNIVRRFLQNPGSLPANLDTQSGIRTEKCHADLQSYEPCLHVQNTDTATDGQTDRQTDGQTDRHRLRKSLFSSSFPAGRPYCISRIPADFLWRDINKQHMSVFVLVAYRLCMLRGPVRLSVYLSDCPSIRPPVFEDEFHASSR